MDKQRGQNTTYPHYPQMCVDKDQHLVPKSKDPQNLDIHTVYRQNRCDIKDPEITTIKNSHRI